MTLYRSTSRGHYGLAIDNECDTAIVGDPWSSTAHRAPVSGEYTHCAPQLLSVTDGGAVV